MARSSAEDVFNDELPADKEKVGELQRLVLETLKPAAQLVLGERWKDEPEQDLFGYRGFSLGTLLNLFVDIAKKTLFQGHEDVTLQTDAQLTSYSTGRTVVHARERAELGSASQTVVSQFLDSDHKPPVGAHMQALTGEGDELPSVASFVDLRDKLLDDQKQGLDKWQDLADQLESARAELGSNYKAKDTSDKTQLVADHALATKSGGAAKGVALVSENAVGVLTSDQVLSHARAGYQLVAGTDKAQSDFGVHASGKASVRAAGDVDLFAKGGLCAEGAASAELSSAGPCLMSSRKGTATLIAPTVQIGGHDPGGRLGGFTFGASSQQKTDLVSIEAGEVNADATDKAIINSGDKVEVTGANEVTIAVGDFSVKLTTSKLTVGHANGTSILEIKNGEVKIGEMMATVTCKKGAGTKIEAGPHSLEVAPSGVKVTGMMINLG